jgi:hypothetical protein
VATAPGQEKSPLNPSEEPRRFGPRGGFRGRLWGLIGIALVLVGAGAIILSSSYDEPKEAKAVGGNIPVNSGAQNSLDLSAHNSPTVVRNPTDEGNVIVTSRIDSPRYSCAMNVSFDGGSSFTQTPIPAPRGEEPKCYAPDVAFGSDGTLYLTYVTLRGRANVPNAVWIARSTDRGRSLTNPERVLGRRAFQTRLTADPSQRGRLYLTYLQASDVGLYKFTEPGNPIRAIRSDDGGSNWSEPTRVNDAGRRRSIAPSTAIGPKGEVYVLYLDLGDDALDYEGAHRGRGGPPFDGRWQLVLARSRDRGATWSELPVKDQLVPTERFIAFTPPSPSVAVAKDGRVYAAFQDGRLGDADVRLWSLPAGGTSWEGPTRVNDTPERDKTSQYLPEVSVAPDGRVDVVYYDRRADRRNVMNEVSFQYSTDEGKKFAERLRLSDRPFSSRVGFGTERGLPDLGSRLGLLSTDSRALAVWTDTRLGTRRTGKQDLAERVVAFNDPPRLSGGVESLLRYGGIALGLVGLLLLGAWLMGQRGGAASPARV